MREKNLKKMKEEKELLDLSMKESIRQRNERVNTNVKWMHSRDFYCDGDGEHPRVYYTITHDIGIVCEYCNIRYKYIEADL